MKTIAFLPARCGSKSIPGKNIKYFYGKPLIYWSLKAADEAPDIDEVVLATDCNEIEKVAQSFNFQSLRIFRRSAENAGDSSSTESVILEYLNSKNYNEEDLFILLQATSPFTTATDLTEAVNMFSADQNIDSVLSCAPFKRFIWEKSGTPVNYDYKNRPRRQEFTDFFIENGAFYISRIKNILNSGNRISGKIALYKMAEFTQLEMDEDDDWLLGETLKAKYQPGIRNDFKNIKLFLSDIDGVMTDGGMYYSEAGDELKKFNTHDGMGFKLLREKGIKTGLVTGENRILNENRFKKLKLDYLFQDVSDKVKVVEKLCNQLNIEPDGVAYIGDDINDKEVLNLVGFPACPASAQDQIKTVPGIRILEKAGGQGVIREFINMIINE